MKILALILLSTICGAQVVKSPAGQMHYLEYTDPACLTKTCPVYIFAAGSGEAGTDITKLYRNGTPKLLKAKGMSYLPGFIMIAPQTTNNNGWIGDPKNPDCIKFLKYVHASYDCRAGVFVSGLSAGGGFAWESTYNLYATDGLVTGIVPVSTASSWPQGEITAKRKIHVWGIHGSADGYFSLNTGKQAINKMISLNANPYPLWTVINGGGHNSLTWDIAYSLTPRTELGGTTIYEWMLKNCKPVDTVPPKVKDTVDSIYTYPGDSSVYFLFKSKRVIKK